MLITKWRQNFYVSSSVLIYTIVWDTTIYLIRWQVQIMLLSVLVHFSDLFIIWMYFCDLNLCSEAIERIYCTSNFDIIILNLDLNYERLKIMIIMLIKILVLIRLLFDPSLRSNPVNKSSHVPLKLYKKLNTFWKIKTHF